jgi:hypothetical protein
MCSEKPTGTANAQLFCTSTGSTPASTAAVVPPIRKLWVPKDLLTPASRSRRGVHNALRRNSRHDRSVHGYRHLMQRLFASNGADGAQEGTYVLYLLRLALNGGGLLYAPARSRSRSSCTGQHSPPVAATGTHVGQSWTA